MYESIIIKQNPNASSAAINRKGINAAMHYYFPSLMV